MFFHAGDQSKCSGGADFTEWDFDRGKLRASPRRGNAIESGYGHLPRDIDPPLAKSTDQFKGLMVCSAYPRGDAIECPLSGVINTLYLTEFLGGKHIDDVPGCNRLTQPGHFLNKGGIAPE